LTEIAVGTTAMIRAWLQALEEPLESELRVERSQKIEEP
jgi:hypothetical protein